MKIEDLRVGDEIEIDPSEMSYDHATRQITKLTNDAVFYTIGDDTGVFSRGNQVPPSAVLRVIRRTELRTGDEFEFLNVDGYGVGERGSRIRARAKQVGFLVDYENLSSGRTGSVSLADLRRRPGFQIIVPSEPKPVLWQEYVPDLQTNMPVPGATKPPGLWLAAKEYTFNVVGEPDWDRIYRENGGASHVEVEYQGKKFVLVPQYVRKHMAAAFVEVKSTAEYSVFSGNDLTMAYRLNAAIQKWRSRVEVTVRSYR